MKTNPLSTVLSGSAGTYRRIKLSLLKEAAGVPCEAWGAGYKPSPVLVHGQETEAVKDAGATWPVVKSVPGFKRLRRNASANPAAPQERIGELECSAKVVSVAKRRRLCSAISHCLKEKSQ